MVGRNPGPGMDAQGLFQEGNPNDPSTPSSVVSAAWLNDVQESLVDVLEQAGIEPELGNVTQLAVAIASIGGGGHALETQLGARLAHLNGRMGGGYQIDTPGRVSWSMQGQWYAGQTNAEPAEDPSTTDVANEVTTGNQPGHYWPYMAPTAQMRAASGFGGGGYPAVYKGHGKNHYRSAWLLGADTLTDRGGVYTFELAGDYIGTDPDRIFEVIAQPNFDLGVGFSNLKGVGFQLGPIPAIGAAQARWHVSIQLECVSTLSGVTVLMWRCNARMGGVDPSLDITMPELVHFTTYSHPTEIDLREPVPLAILFKTDADGDVLGAAGASNPNRSGSQGQGVESIVRCSRFRVSYDS